MVSIALLAGLIVPMLLLREESYQKALHSQALRTAQELAMQQLAVISMEVRIGKGGGEMEGWPEYRYEYEVTLYDFGAGVEDDEESLNDPYNNFNQPGDSVFVDEDADTIGPMVMRHVELRIFYPTLDYESEDGEEEYIVDTYIPALLTEEQFEKQNESLLEEDSQ
jgi:hypothetical protein